MSQRRLWAPMLRDACESRGASVGGVRMEQDGRGLAPSRGRPSRRGARRARPRPAGRARRAADRGRHAASGRRRRRRPRRLGRDPPRRHRQRRPGAPRPRRRRGARGLPRRHPALLRRRPAARARPLRRRSGCPPGSPAPTCCPRCAPSPPARATASHPRRPARRARGRGPPNLRARHPGLGEIVDAQPAARRSRTTPRLDAAVLAGVVAARPDVVFVCLGSPKQELWVHRRRDRLPDRGLPRRRRRRRLRGRHGEPPLPAGWRDYGLEWLHRLLHDWRRLWRRYLVNDVRFLRVLLVQVVRDRRAGRTASQRVGRAVAATGGGARRRPRLRPARVVPRDARTRSRRARAAERPVEPPAGSAGPGVKVRAAPAERRTWRLERGVGSSSRGAGRAADGPTSPAAGSRQRHDRRLPGTPLPPMRFGAVRSQRRRRARCWSRAPCSAPSAAVIEELVALAWKRQSCSTWSSPPRRPRWRRRADLRFGDDVGHSYLLASLALPARLGPGAAPRPAPTSRASSAPGARSSGGSSTPASGCSPWSPSPPTPSSSRSPGSTSCWPCR